MKSRAPRLARVSLALLLTSCLGCGGGGTNATLESAPKAPVVRTDLPQLESRFKALMAAEVVAGIDGNHATAWLMVGRGFYSLTYEQKTAAAQLVSDHWAAVKGGEPGSAVPYEIHDQYSGDLLYEWNGYKLKR